MSSSQQPKQPSRRTREELQQLYMTSLEKEGYRPELDDDGDVRFRHEGHSYFLEVREDDPMFFRAVLPNFWDIDSLEERSRAVNAANYACGEIPIAKVFVVRDSMWSAVELFLADQADFVSILQRSLLSIRQCANVFSEHMRAEPPPPPSVNDGDDAK